MFVARFKQVFNLKLKSNSLEDVGGRRKRNKILSVFLNHFKHLRHLLFERVLKKKGLIFIVCLKDAADSHKDKTAALAQHGTATAKERHPQASQQHDGQDLKGI